MRLFKKLLTVTIALMLIAEIALAQNTVRKEASSFGARRQLATIIFAGLSGAILGLSTLSFYGRPQERLSNIAVGFALGVFAGTVYTTYKAAAKPAEFYGPGTSFDYFESPHSTIAAGAFTYKPIQLEWSF